MSKTRACFNCLWYEQTPEGQDYGYAPRCTKGLNPSLGHAPPNLHIREEGSFEPDQMAAFCDSYLWAPVRFPRLRKSSKFRLSKDPRYTTAGYSEKFLPFYERGTDCRLKIERGVQWTSTDYGHVSTSTGWQPVLLLMRSTKANGSSVILDDDCRIVAVKWKGDSRYKRYGT